MSKTRKIFFLNLDAWVYTERRQCAAATRKVVNHNLQSEEERRGLGVSELTVASNKTSCAMLQQRRKHIRFQ